MTDFSLWVAGGAAVLGGVLSTLHMSLRESSRGAVLELAEMRRKGELLGAIMDRWSDHALAVSLPRLLCNLVTVVATLVYFTGMGPESHVGWPELGKALGLSLLVIYVVGVVVPASLADHAGERIVVSGASVIRALYFVVLPLARLGLFVDALVKRFGGARPHTRAEEIERELLSVVEEGESEGSIGQSERMMIEGVVDLRSRITREIMRPRTEIEAIPYTDDLLTVRDFVGKSGHSRIPVFEGDLDRIAGVLYAKDLLDFLGADPKGFKLRPVLREAHFVPETKPLLNLLAEFQRLHIHMAIVLDEYGLTSGLVTIEDLLEEIVGEIEDERGPDEDEPRIAVLPAERAVEADARATIVDLNEELEPLEVEVPEGEDYETVGGFVLSALGRIPVAGETFTKDGLAVKVLEAGPMRVGKVRIEFPAKVEEGGEETAEAERVMGRVEGK